jgi:hypothetical protein
MQAWQILPGDYDVFVGVSCANINSVLPVRVVLEP